MISFAINQLLGRWHRLDAEVVEVACRREPHTLLPFRHPPEELGVLAERVVRALEVVTGSKVV